MLAGQMLEFDLLISHYASAKLLDVLIFFCIFAYFLAYFVSLTDLFEYFFMVGRQDAM